MEARELRLKNFISDGIFTFLVSEISKDSIIKGISITPDGLTALEIDDYWRLGAQYSLDHKNVFPIPLTEEWLLKFGFFLFDDNEYCKEYKVSSNFKSYFNLYVEDRYYYVSDYDIEIYHVHQLQNIYFALTGEELTIKEI